MKVQGENIVATGSELDDIARYPLSGKFDTYLSDVLSFDIEYDQDNINKYLTLSLTDWEQAPLDYQYDDNVPREYNNFKSFIERARTLKAREAALILRYTGEEFSEERTKHEYSLSGDFAADIAVASILHTAVNIEKSDSFPVIDLPIYREVQNLPDYESARQAWIQTLFPERTPRSAAYWSELQRKDTAYIAGESLRNAYMLSDEFGFSLSGSVKTYLNRRKPRK